MQRSMNQRLQLIRPLALDDEEDGGDAPMPPPPTLPTAARPTATTIADET